MGPKVISITDDSDSKRLFVGSQDERASFRDTSLHLLFFDEDARGVHMDPFMLHSSHATINLASPVMSVLEM